VLEQYVELLANYSFEERIGNSLVVQDPVGVVAAITPWNYPLHQMVAKVGAALAAGCTVVMKPSGLAPLSTFALADAAERSGLPAGVLNLITGPGARLGRIIGAHPAVDMISFTGSTAAGASLYQIAAASIKRVALELGGKSASVILEDADLTAAVGAGVNNAFLNSGQTCTALTRMLVPQSLLRDVIDLAVAASQRLPLGDPFEETTRLGPLVSRAQVEAVRGYVESGIQQGAEIVTGGPEQPREFEKGFYFRPTILTRVQPDMDVARDEIFGPVLCILAYGTEDEALAIANATEYGLSGAVWSRDSDRATRFARGMVTGQVDINGGRFNAAAPFGGMKNSGIGRELGRYGLEEFLQPKALQF
jgi:betaine-aldehyde dehydrogenase